MVGDELARPPAEAEGQPDAAAGERRDMARGIADQHDILCSTRADGAAAWNEAAPPLLDACPAETEERLGMGQKGLEIGLGGLAHRQAHLKKSRCRRHPGEIAPRQPRIEEAVQEIGTGLRQIVIFDLQSGEEFPVLPKIEQPRHRGARTIGAHEITCLNVEVRQQNATVNPRCGLDFPPAENFGTGLSCFVRQPADEARRVGGEEIVTLRGKVDRLEIGRIEADGVNGPAELRGDIDLLGRFLDQNPSGVDARSRIALGLDHGYGEAPQGRGPGADETGKARANNHQIGAARRHVRSGSTASP